MSLWLRRGRVLALVAWFIAGGVLTGNFDGNGDEEYGKQRAEMMTHAQMLLREGTDEALTLAAGSRDII